MCKQVITNGNTNGPNFHNLCDGLAVEYQDMVRALRCCLLFCRPPP